MFASRFTPDQSRFAEFLACLWQGPVPASLVLSKWLYLPGEPRQMLLVWDGDDATRAYIERAFGGFGTLDTQTVTDATPGLAAALDRDLDAFGRHLERAGHRRKKSRPRSAFGAAVWKPRRRTTRPPPGVSGRPNRRGAECRSSTTRSLPTTSARGSR